MTYTIPKTLLKLILHIYESCDEKDLDETANLIQVQLGYSDELSMRVADTIIELIDGNIALKTFWSDIFDAREQLRREYEQD